MLWYQVPAGASFEKILDVAQQAKGHVLFSSVAWDLGHQLIDQQEYAQAAECFRRMWHSAEGSADPFLVKAACTAMELCAVLSREQPVVNELQGLLRALRRNLFQLSYEEVNFAAQTLTAYVRDGSAIDHHLLMAFPASRATEATVKNTLPQTKMPTANQHELSTNRSKQPFLQVRFFGCFEILCNGETVSLDCSAKALAILKYMLAHRDRPVSQDYLMGWLWPEASHKQARWSLYSAARSVRSLLGKALSPSAASTNYFLCERGHCCLAINAQISIDVEEFCATYEKGRQLERAQQMQQATAEYETAIELYRCDYLIEDLYEDWTLIEREWLSSIYVDALNRVANYYMETEQPYEAIQTCYRLLQKDPCDEYSHRLLMRCYTYLGLHARVLRQYRLCQQVLKNRLGIEPSAETKTLLSKLIDGRAL